MIRSSSISFLIWRWWRRRRRQPIRLRRISLISILFPCLIIVLIIQIAPNPYDPQYEKKSIDQDVEWSRIDEVIQAKEIIYNRDNLINLAKVVHSGTGEKKILEPILILLYTTVFLNKKYCHFSIDRIFGSSCPSKNRCQWSCDRQQLRQADAIIFHAYDIQYYQAHIPKRHQTKHTSIWILWSDEPPSIINYTLFKSYEFNWTISYKLNSEVSIGAYGLLSKREFTWSNPDYNRWIQNQFRNRLNGALWFVSNCDAKERLKYFYELRNVRNTTVEGYGRCVDYYPMHLCTANTQCEHDYMGKFKIFLSFESTTCGDYITEKFYKSLYHGLIPVVVGPEPSDYQNLAPPHSFIHINHYDKNMQRLASYLHDVYSDFELYSMYHQWRKKYTVIIDGKGLDRVRMCELCERLSKVREGDITYYQDIEKFYSEKC